MEVISNSQDITTPLINAGEEDVDGPMFIINNIKCVRYTDGSNYRVKIIQKDPLVIPEKHTYKKKKKMCSFLYPYDKRR